MDTFMIVVSLCALCIMSFLIVSLSLPPLVSKLSQVGRFRQDLHKKETTMVPSSGGLSVLLGFCMGIMLTSLLGLDQKVLLVVYLVTLLAAIVGTVDDFLNLSKTTMILLTLLIGFTFVIHYQGSTAVVLPFLGKMDLGLWFWPLSMLGIAFLGNAVNIYSPLNGLEAGLGFITCFGLSVCALIYGSFESAYALSLMGASLLAILRWDRYPSRVFIGNVGAYMIGTLMASSIIAGNIKVAGFISCIPYTANFFLRATDKFRKYTATVLEDGLIVADAPKTLWSMFILHKPKSERTVVYYCWIVQALFSVAAIAYSFTEMVTRFD